MDNNYRNNNQYGNNPYQNAGGGYPQGNPPYGNQPQGNPPYGYPPNAAGGMNGGNQPKKPKSRFGLGLLVGVLITIAALMLAAVLFVFVYLRGMRTGTTEMDYQEKLDTIQSYLDAYYLWDIDPEMIEDGLASGLLSGIGDKYAKYYTKEEFDNLMEETSGSYGGIGISIMMNNDNTIEVYKVFSGTPADEAGIQVKDLIVEADGVREFEDLDELVSIVRGEEGTTVDLVIKRGDQEIPMTVERKVIDMETVTYKMLDNKIGYIQLTEFDIISVEQFNTALDALEAEGMTSLILDLRDNPGGDYDTVISMADRVLPEGKITTVVDKQGTEKTETSDEEHQISIPMVVLINENSASASELFTGAIKDYGIATIVGETSYGKGIVQSIFRLSDGSGLKFTTEEYLTPNGNHINGIGVTPDVEITIPEEAYEDGELTEEEDAQLQTAIEILTGGAAAGKQ